MSKGWKGESVRHGLAWRKIHTSHHETVRKPGDSLYDPIWSGVSYAPEKRGVVCERCGSHVHNEAGNSYCPHCDDYVHVVKKQRYNTE